MNGRQTQQTPDRARTGVRQPVVVVGGTVTQADAMKSGHVRGSSMIFYGDPMDDMEGKRYPVVVNNTAVAFTAEGLQKHFPKPRVSDANDDLFGAPQVFEQDDDGSGFGDDDDDSANFMCMGSAQSMGDSLPKPKFVDHYVLGTKLGEGAHAKVKEGMDSRSLRIVAVKIVNKDFMKKIPGGLDDIQREITIMKGLKKHPNIIQLLEVLDEPDGKRKMYIVLELANSCTLHDLVEQAPNQRLPLEQAQYFLHQMLRGLLYIHGKNVVHRDIKPANCMLTTDYELKIADFGVAEFLNTYEAKDYVSRTTGSPAFQSPEIANGDASYSGMKVDVWAAGVTLFFMLTGTVPFEAQNLIQLFAKIGQAEYEIPDYVDEQAADLIRHMMERDFEARYNIRDCLSHPFIKSAPMDPRDDWVKPVLREPQITRILSAMYENEADLFNSTSLDANVSPSFAQSSLSLPEQENKSTASKCTIM
ncbi:Serine/threonine-protein kinase STK11 [Porphyridium purpureum]|uniref:non-specific serine/threonine protein kinase n=1 Tax=Porphyridium purpureum TaxID=35688 RepID=A0A5J4Z4U5_PORPP|nr:Serine/threonine-protein kinase STK11 [Porphyridium purpureum]|eukprot:POR4311..scf295_1